VEPLDRVILGKKAEDAAAEYIKEQGYRLRERNFRCPLGEIDIIAEDQGVLVFVEVRSRTKANFGLPEETVNWVKQQKLRRLAAAYLQRTREWGKECRFDVIGVLFGEQEQVERLELIKNAF